MKILFLGSSRFSKIVLNKMLDNGLDIIGVITQPDKPSGRGHKLTPTVVKSYALEKNIKVYDFDKVKNHIEEIKKIDYDLAVVASFGQILPEDFLNIKLTINVHPSLLPKYRGASPIQSALLEGDKISGVTIMKVAKEVDSGDILLQRQFAISDEYYLELEEKLACLGGEMACQAVKLLEKGEARFTPQQHEKATFTSKFTKEDGFLDFNLSAEQNERRVRALSEESGCFVRLNQQELLKIGKVKATNEFSLQPKEVLFSKKRFVIGCAQGALEILTCQSPSGKMINGRDYLNGHNEILGGKVF